MENIKIVLIRGCLFSMSMLKIDFKKQVKQHFIIFIAPKPASSATTFLHDYFKTDISFLRINKLHL